MARTATGLDPIHFDKNMEYLLLRIIRSKRIASLRKSEVCDTNV